jgi:hypothetical protein
VPAGRALRPRSITVVACGPATLVGRHNDTLIDETVDDVLRHAHDRDAYLRARFLPSYNATFSCAPTDPASAFVPVGRVDLDQILCHQETRVVARDNTVAFDGRTFQLARQPGRRSCAGLAVTIRRHLAGAYSIWHGARRLGDYPAVLERPRDPRTAVQPVAAAGAVDAQNASTAPWKTHNARFPQLPQASV